MTKASLSSLKHLSLQLHCLTGASFKVSLKITVQMGPPVLSTTAVYKGVRENDVLPQIIQTVGVRSNHERNMQIPCSHLLGISYDRLLK